MVDESHIHNDAGEGVFWNWTDAALFLGLLAPCAALALLLAKGFFYVIPLPNQISFLLGFQFTGYGLWLTALYGLMRVRYGRPFWPSMGWQFPWPGLGLTVAVGPVLALAVGLGASLMQTPDRGSDLQALMKDRLAVILVGIFSTTLGPLCEELVFRGFFQPLLVRQFGKVLGILLCAAPFALLHGPQYHWTWQIVVLLTLAGATFGYIRQAARSTAASTLVHATYNLTYFTAYLIQKDSLF